MAVIMFFSPRAQSHAQNHNYSFPGSISSRIPSFPSPVLRASLTADSSTRRQFRSSLYSPLTLKPALNQKLFSKPLQAQPPAPTLTQHIFCT